MVLIQKQNRNWDTPRSFKEWNKMKADKTIERDEQGPAHSPLCLAVPAALMGQRSIIKRKIEFSENICTQESKAAKKESDIKAMVEDAKRDMDKAPDFVATDLIRHAGHLVGDGGIPADNKDKSPVPSSGQSPGSSGVPAGEADKPKDVCLERTVSGRRCAAAVAKACEDLKKLVGKCKEVPVAMDYDAVNVLLVDRVQFACAFLGHECKMTGARVCSHWK